MPTGNGLNASEKTSKRIPRSSTPNRKKCSAARSRSRKTWRRRWRRSGKLPATRRYSYYLDPQLHYAVRRLDQSYGSDQLLVRSDCSDFQQISGRNVWLPKKIESQMHEYFCVPDTVFKENFLVSNAFGVGDERGPRFG